MSKKEETLIYRYATLDPSAVNEESREVQLSFSSEEPVERSDGTEVLGHRTEEIDLRFMQNGSAPLLLDHDRREQIGVVSAVRVEDGRGKATVRFGRSGRATEIFNDVVDGIRTNVSVGYVVKDYKRQGDGVYRVTRWVPKEISIVSIPADATVGVGRSEETAVNNQEEIKMTDKTETRAEGFESTVDVNAIRAETRAEANKSAAERVRKIQDFCTRRGLDSEIADFINSDKSFDEIREIGLDMIEKRQASVKPASANIGMSEKETRNYSLLRAIRALAFPNEAKFQKEAGLEIEASRAAAQRMGTTPEGILVPYDVLTRDLNVTGGTATEGANLVATDLLAGSFIELLRNRMVVQALGARMLSGLNGNIAIPRQSGAATAYWVAEGNAPTESQQAIDQVTMSPKTVGAFTDYTRQTLLQSSIDVERMVMDDLATVLALAMDKAALYGTGLNGQPTGVSVQSGINAPTDFAAAVPTFAEIVAMETAVAVDNALMGNLAYLTDPTTRGGLKTQSKAGTEASFVWEGSEVNGYRAEVSSQVTAGDVFFGNWADLIIGLWGGLDLTIDPYSLSTTGTKRIVALQSCDIAVRHPVSFAFNSDGV